MSFTIRRKERQARMIPDIIDNSSPEKRLSNVLNELIRPESKVYIASGYFNLSGFKLLKDKLKDAAEVSIIIGRALSPKDIYASEVFLDELRHEAESNMDSPQTEGIIKEFLNWLESEKVNFRIYNKHFYHGKTYIVEGIPVVGSIGIVGSSNFTEAGLTHNTELNTVQKQESAVSELKKVFERIWQEGENYKEDLKNLYTWFTEAYSPYEIYLKTLYSYFEDKFASVSPEDDIPSPIILSDFQRDGYLGALDIFERYGGVLISDSVGLGKTYLALRILDDFAYRLRQKALIICSAQLKGLLWEPKLRDAGIRSDIVSRETISRDFPVERYANYDLIVVDESHNFRNSNTNCWKNLFSLLIQGKPKKLVLITATPVNNSVFDLYNQIRLITKDRDDYFSAAGIQSIWGHFLKADINKDTLYDLLDEIAIRRSRPFIRKYYPSALIDGESVKFPERKLYEAHYNLEKTYKGLYDECSKAIENLALASYNIDAYRKEMIGRQIELFETLKETLLEKGWKENEAQKFLMTIGRNEAVIAILKMMLLKRLESSIP
ncbi:MAG: phospholipase D-like domain-containing protein, partial [Nitrospirota bacterium]